MKLEFAKTNEFTLYFTAKTFEIEDLLKALKSTPEGCAGSGSVAEFVYFLQSILRK